jgi:hypothetical protein
MLLDMANGAVSVRLRALPAPHLVDIAVDEEGTIFLLDIDNMIHEYAPGAAAPRTSAPVSRRLRSIKGLLLAGGTLYVHTSSQFVYPIRRDGRYLTPAEQEAGFREGLPGAAPGHISTAVEDHRTGSIRRRDTEGRVIEEWPLRFPGPPLMTLILVGTEPGGRIVVASEAANPAGRPAVFREILVCEGGEAVTTIRLPFIYHSYINRDLAVLPSGDILHMLSDEDGISLFRLRPDATGPPGRLNYPGQYQRVVHFNERLRTRAPELPDDVGR